MLSKDKFNNLMTLTNTINRQLQSYGYIGKVTLSHPFLKFLLAEHIDTARTIWKQDIAKACLIDLIKRCNLIPDLEFNP